MARVPENKRFIFIAGAEGSGTTLLLRFLTHPAGCVSLGGNYIKVPPSIERRVEQYLEINGAVWDRSLSSAENAKAKQIWRDATDSLLAAPEFESTTHFFLKRSFPFGQPRGRYTPDLMDVADEFAGVRFIAIYREPKAASFSALRRDFDTDLRRLAVSCAEHLTWLSAQLRAVGPDRYRVVNYEHLCTDPLGAVAPLAEWCGLSMDELRPFAAEEKFDRAANSKWAERTSDDDREFLKRYFDERRSGQWELLRR